MKHIEQVSHYTQHVRKFNLHGISFLMGLKDILKFKRLKKVSISVFGYQEGKED